MVGGGQADRAPGQNHVSIFKTIASTLAIAGGLALFTFASVSGAAEFGTGDGESGAFDLPYLDELRLGGFYTNPDQKERGGVVQIEAVFARFITHDFGNIFLNAALQPRIHVGGNINVTGDTSVAFTGLTWQLPLYGPLFVEGEFGGGIHNGKLTDAGRKRQQLGCRVLFHESGSIGLQFDRLSVMGTIEHFSNAGFCTENDGLTNVGVRVGYRF